MYDQRDTNGTEIRAVAGNFLFSTGANEFAGRYTAGHFDLPVMRTTITVDDTVVVKDGVRAGCVWDAHPEARAKRASKDGGSCSGARGRSLRGPRFARAPQDEVYQSTGGLQPEMPQHLDERLQPFARDRPPRPSPRS